MKTRSEFMRRVRIAALATAALCVAMAPSSSFAEAKSATLSATGYSGTETLTGFPALVKLSATDDAYGFSYSDCVNGKDDLWFEDADGNLIPHDVDTWNETGDSYVWVRIPSLSNGTKIVMHWGATRTAAQTCTTSDTWAGYVGVWHMNETGTTAEPDATANGLDATPLTSGSADTSLNTATGTVGAGRAIPSDGKYFSVGSSSNPYHSTLTTKANFSVSGWCKMSSIPNNNGYQRIFCGMSSSSLHSWDVWREHATQIGVRSGTGSANKSSTSYFVAISDGETSAHYLTNIAEFVHLRLHLGVRDLCSMRSAVTHKYKCGRRLVRGFKRSKSSVFSCRFDNGVSNILLIFVDFGSI